MRPVKKKTKEKSMATVGTSSLLTIADAILLHWEKVNEQLSPQTLLLSGNYARTNLQTELERARTAEAAITKARVDVKRAASLRDQSKTKLQPVPTAFRRAVEYRHYHSAYTAHCPDAPAISAVESRFLAPLADVLTLWNGIDVDEPMVLPGGLTRNQFADETDLLRHRYRDLAQKEVALGLARAQRDDYVDAFRPRLIEFRAAVLATFPKKDTMVTLLPKIKPVTRKRKKKTDETAPVLED